MQKNTKKSLSAGDTRAISVCIFQKLCYTISVSFIRFDNVSYSYNAGTEDEVAAVRDVSLSIEEGEFVALVGHNGSGKSTLAKLMNGLFLPRSGTVTVDGISTAAKRDKKYDPVFEIRKRVGVVFQNPDNQMVASIIEDDIAFGPENLGVPPKEISERVAWALAAVGMSEHRKGTPFRLSGGQKQRVAIAGVLALRPKVMVLDESTAMLDPAGRAEVIEVVKKLNRDEKMAVVLITHFMEEALSADRIVILNEGRIAFEGGREIFNRGKELAAIGLDVPLVCRVAEKLRERGVSIPEGVMEAGELVDAIVKK